MDHPARWSYLLTPLGNQKTLHRTLKALPWKNVPSFSSVDTGHGRRVRRTVKAVKAPAWVDFSAAAQVVQVRHTRTTSNHKNAGGNSRAKTTGRKTSAEVVYLICSLSMTDAQPQQVTAWIQGHRRIEKQLHWVRDVIFDEDRHQLRTANGPQIMATLRNLAISLIRLPHGPRTAIASTTSPCHDNPNKPSNYPPDQPPKPTLPTPWTARRARQRPPAGELSPSCGFSSDSTSSSDAGGSGTAR